MRRGWYIIPGVQTGDRTLEQQIIGLDHIDFRGKTVLELGCAEGLMSRWMIERGAKEVHGLEVVGDHVKEAWNQCRDAPATFEHRDLNYGVPSLIRYDIVMALAILHKLKKPARAASEAARCARETLVVRLPPGNAPWIVDARSGYVPIDIESILLVEGFGLTAVTRGHLDEWCGTYRRKL